MFYSLIVLQQFKSSYSKYLKLTSTWKEKEYMYNNNIKKKMSGSVFIPTSP